MNRKAFVVYLIIIAGGLGILIYATSCGVIFTDDSDNYLSAARSFLESGKFVSPDQTPFSSWPPLFSMIIAFFLSLKIFRLEILQYLTYILNGLLLAGMAEKYLKASWAKYFYVIVSMYSVSLIMVHTFLWSEALFLSILLIFIGSVWKSLENDNWKNILFLILISNLLCLQRNAGLFALIGIVTFLFLFSSIKRIKILVLLAGGSLGFFLWNIYATYVFSDGFHFLRHDYLGGFFNNLLDLLNVGTAWLLPRVIPAFLRIGVFILALLFFFLYTRKKESKMELNKPGLLLVFIIFSYLIALLSIGPLDFYEIERYVSFLFPLVLLFSIGYLESVRVKRYGIALILVLWASYSITRALKNTWDWYERSCQPEKIDSYSNNKSIHSLINV